MAKDLTYTNGVIAVREKYLLKDKILKLCETGADEALRSILESGFGGGAEVSSVYDYEKLVSADEADIDAFIREYAPSKAEKEYLLSPRDFHNAKALVKAVYLNLEAEKLLAPDGLVPAEEIFERIKNNDLTPLNKELQEAVKVSAQLFAEGDASGAEIGIIFEKALFSHLSAVCSKNLLLKKLIAVKADMTNILTALRSDSAEYAEKCFVSGGKLTHEKLLKLFDEDKGKAVLFFKDTPYYDFIKSCFDSIEAGLPLTQAEKVAESYETEYFAARKYDLKRSQPFLYYVFRRRAENANVRILFVCLLAGMREGDIKRRLRAT
ncbi:MAG: V-type ATPase subunit [Clostridia bacterium]|nr:V-type ATPase subunit [Clostridia bacterium]